MRSLLSAITIATVIIGGLSGCAAKATPDECASACKNVTRLYLGEVKRQTEINEELKAMGSTALKEAEAMARIQLDLLQKECQKECNSVATRKDAQCLQDAKTKADLDLCGS